MTGSADLEASPLSGPRSNRAFPFESVITAGPGGSPVNATLLQGGYVATHTYGWTEFEIPTGSANLIVTTYGVDPAQPNAAPGVVSKFSVARQ